MNASHFYMTLPSNTSRQYYGKQEPSAYTTKLDHALSLDPSIWEVGLAQLTYPRSWHNLPKATFYIIYPNVGAEDSPFENPTMYSIAEFGGTRYVSAKHLVRDLQHAIRQLLPAKDQQAIRIKFDDVSHRAKFTIQDDFAIWMETPLANTLGLTSKVGSRFPLERRGSKKHGLLVPELATPPGEAVIIPPYTVCVDRLIQTLYIYCDLVNPQLVGDSYVQLLRTIDVPDEGFGERITHKFTNVHYSSLQTGTFETIKIMIADGQGRLIDFKHSDVITKLHFRKKHH